MSHGIFHGKSIEEIVDIRVKEYEMRKLKEREELETLRRQQAENKADITAPHTPAPAPQHSFMPTVHKWMHKLHLE